MKSLFLNSCAAAIVSAGLFGCVTDSTTTTVTPETAAPRALPSMSETMPANAEAALAQAQVQRKNGEIDAAVHTLSQLVLIAPDDPRVLGEYGKAVIAQGRSDDAIAFLTRATQLSPNDWTLYAAMGVALDQKGDYKAAQAQYAHALILKPGEPSVLSNAAMSHLQQGDLKGAHALLLQAKARSSDPKILKNIALVESLEAEAATRTAVVAPVHAAAPKPAATAAIRPSTAAPAKPAPAPTRTANAVPAPSKPVANAATHAPATLAKPGTPERTAAATPTLRTTD